MRISDIPETIRSWVQIASNLIATALLLVAVYGMVFGPGYLGWLLPVALLFVEIPDDREFHDGGDYK